MSQGSETPRKMLPPIRMDWPEYFLGIAEAVSQRSSCERAKVGAVLVDKHRRISGSGYNDAPQGKPGCEQCPRRTSEVLPDSQYSHGPGRCVAIHAEANAVLYCSWEARQGATLYVTRAPCPECTKLLSGSGIRKVVWPEGELDLT
jgi:dCMP deaminase